MTTSIRNEAALTRKATTTPAVSIRTAPAAVPTAIPSIITVLPRAEALAACSLRTSWRDQRPAGRGVDALITPQTVASAYTAGSSSRPAAVAAA